MAVTHEPPTLTVPLGHMVCSSAVLDAVSCLVLVADLTSGEVVSVNSAVQALTGLSLQEVVGTAWEDLFEEADHDSVRAAIDGPGGVALGFESTLRTRSGVRRRVLWSVALINDSHTRRGQVVLSGIDVTPEVHTSGLFSQLMRTAAAPALVGTDLRGRITLYNSAAETMLGYPASAVVGRRLDEALFDRAELEERAGRLGVSANLGLLAGDLSKLDRRRSNPDLGSLDRRRRDGEQRGVGESLSDRRGEGGRRSDRRDEGESRSDRGCEGGRGAGSTPQARDWTMIRRGGEKFTASLAVVHVTDCGGEVVGYLGVAEDVTEQRRSRNLLVAGLAKEAEAVRRLQELDRAKDDFVATVSHELRTPITSILGYVELLLESLASDVAPRHVEMLEAVQRNGDRLRALADDLLTLSSFESGEFTLEVAEVNLGAVVERVAEAVGPLVVDRRLDISFEVPTQEVVINGDDAHLERVLFHLLSNALKFTEDGGSIACTLRVDTDTAIIEVSDTGIGIPREEQSQLFTRFFRSSSSQERAIQGPGMGLAIVETIVRRHGGEVSIVSEENKGTVVGIHLPCSGASAAEICLVASESR